MDYDTVRDMMINHKGSQQMAEEVFWHLDLHSNSEEAIKKLSESFKLPMPSGVKGWDSKMRIVIINDNFQEYVSKDQVRDTRSVWFWSRYITARGWPWVMFKRNAERGGTVLMFQLPLPKAKEEVKEEATQEVTPEVIKTKEVKAPKVIRNKQRRQMQEIKIEDMDDEE